jgi:pilus assembly protein FimV
MVRVIKPVGFLRLVFAAALSLPLLAQAAGLGRLSVQSNLGQPLRAEIEVVALQAGEESSLEARLASGNAFAQAGIDFNPVLVGVRFVIDKRDGRTVLRVTTRQPVSEPFLDMLVELRWATGLLVREYTVLLDPPDYKSPKAVAAVPAVPATIAAAPTAPTAPAAPAAPVAEAAPAAPVADAAPAAPVADAAPAAPVADAAKPEPRIEERPIAAVAAPAEAKVPQSYEVKKGDTLGAIARQYRPEGVTFNQMLIALQRANEDAFIRNNVNLVRAGRILNIPDREAVSAVEAPDANRLISAQMADFAEYRSRLAATVAAAPAQAVPAERATAGQITPKPDEPKPAEPKDQLKLSKADPKKPGAPAAKAAREDDRTARERALKEAQSRVTDLEKNVADMQKLIELKNQQLAELEKKSAKPPPPAPAPAAKAPEPPKATPAPQAARAPEAKPAGCNSARARCPETGCQAGAGKAQARRCAAARAEPHRRIPRQPDRVGRVGRGSPAAWRLCRLGQAA